MILQLDPPIPLDTPKGKAQAMLLIDYGPEYHLIWCCFIDSTGESWQFLNPYIRLRSNETMRPKHDGTVTT